MVCPGWVADQWYNRHAAIRVGRLLIPTRNRYTPDTLSPTTPKVAAAAESPSSRTPVMPAPLTTRIPVAMTTVECPAENAIPTDTGRRPSATNFRVVLSIIETWSKSSECSRPRV
jgi:hypothetical protein